MLNAWVFYVLRYAPMNGQDNFEIFFLIEEFGSDWWTPINEAIETSPGVSLGVRNIAFEANLEFSEHLDDIVSGYYSGNGELIDYSEKEVWGSFIPGKLYMHIDSDAPVMFIERSAHPFYSKFLVGDMKQEILMCDITGEALESNLVES